MSWLGNFLGFLEKLGLRGPMFFFFAATSAFLMYASDSWLTELRLADLRKTYATWIEIAFVVSTALTLPFLYEWSRKATRRCRHRVRRNRDRVELLNGLSSIEHQILESHFRREGLRENTVLISDTSIERDALIKLRQKMIVTVVPMRSGARDWRPSPVSVTIAPWAWNIMNSTKYKPNLSGVDAHR
jgi:hypothetical protein